MNIKHIYNIIIVDIYKVITLRPPRSQHIPTIPVWVHNSMDISNGIYSNLLAKIGFPNQMLLTQDQVLFLLVK